MRSGIFIVAVAAAFLAASCSTGRRGQESAAESPDTYATPEKPAVLPRYSKTTLIVLYDAETGSGPLEKAVRKSGSSIKYKYSSFSGMAITIPKGKSLDEMIDYFSKVKGVVSVNKDQIYYLDDPVVRPM